MLSLRHYRFAPIAHSHEHVQLVFGLSGELDFEIAGRGSRIARQALAIIPAATHHSCASEAGSDCLVLDVPGEHWLQERLGAQAGDSLRLLDRAATLQLSARQLQLVNWLAAAPVGDPVLAESAATLLLNSLSNAEQVQTKVLPWAALDDHIDRHLAHPLAVEDLAGVARLSSARLHARFLAEAGQTPMEYVRRRRLQQGQALLRSTDLAVGEIAARVGYSSQSAFTAALGRAFGCTPRALRRELRDNSPE